MKASESQSSLIQGEFSVERAYPVLRHRWWWLIAALIGGALAGLMLSAVLPPSYQATASLGIGIDYGRTHSLEREAERQALLQVQELMLSDAVLKSVTDDVSQGLQSRNSLVGPKAFREQLRLDRFDGRWDLSVYSRFPEDAAELANRWSEASAEAIEVTLEAAWQARDLQQQIFGMGCQLETAEEGQQPVFQCLSGEPEQAIELQQAVVKAAEKSHGLLPALTFAQLRQASIPGQPIYRARSWLVLGGLMVGLALGLVLVLAFPYDFGGQTKGTSGDQSKDGPID